MLIQAKKLITDSASATLQVVMKYDYQAFGSRTGVYAGTLIPEKGRMYMDLQLLKKLKCN